MKRLEQLPQITDQALGGLNATEGLKYRILSAAREDSAPPRRRAMWVPVACASLALALTLGIAIPRMTAQPDDQPLISAISAGSSETASANEGTLVSLNNNSVSVSSRSHAPAFRSLWAQSSGGSFPMIGADGRYYRMMTSPTAVSSGLLGSKIGEVKQFTTEPALAASGVIMSNRVPSGTAVYEIRGMGKTLLAAEVDGSYRLFQRVSFNGSALRGSEKLADTLQIAKHITMMELSGVGTVSDSAKCEKLFSTLTKYADYASSGSVSSQQSLLIELDNGLTVQLMVKNDKLSACGVWSCPEFFDAFAEAVR